MKNLIQSFILLTFSLNTIYGQATENQEPEDTQANILESFATKNEINNFIIPLYSIKMNFLEILESKNFYRLSYENYKMKKLENRKNEIQKIQNMKQGLKNKLIIYLNCQRIYNYYPPREDSSSLQMMYNAIHEIIDFSISPSIEILMKKGFNQSQSQSIINTFKKVYGSLNCHFYEIPKIHFKSKKEFTKNLKSRDYAAYEMIDQKVNEGIELLHENSKLLNESILRINIEEFQEICNQLWVSNDHQKSINLESLHIQNWYLHILDIISQARKDVINGEIDQAKFKYTNLVSFGFYSKSMQIIEEVYSQKNPYFWLLDEMIQFFLSEESEHISECLKILLQKSVYVPLANLESIQKILCTSWLEQAILEDKKLESLTNIFMSSSTLWKKSYNTVFQKIENLLKD